MCQALTAHLSRRPQIHITLPAQIITATNATLDSATESFHSGVLAFKVYFISLLVYFRGRRRQETDVGHATSTRYLSNIVCKKQKNEIYEKYVTNSTDTVVPVKSLCALCLSLNIFSLLTGKESRWRESWFEIHWEEIALSLVSCPRVTPRSTCVSAERHID